MRILLAILFLIPSALMAGDTAPRMTVVGVGQVTIVPDMATISLGVSHQAKTARAAVSEVNAGVGAMLARLQEAKVEDRDIQTSGLNLSPRLDYTSAGESRLRGYEASNTLRLRVRDLSKLGVLLDDVVTGGATQFHGLSFGLQMPRPVEDEARRAAVADAMAKAALYADAAGLTLGPILSISEASSGGGDPMMLAMQRSMASEAVPVAPGEMTVSMTVTVQFGLIQQ